MLAEHRPGDAVLSEEGKDDKTRLEADRVWIIDPVDGTREFSEPPRDDWAVHVALWAGTGSGGELVAGAVAQPGAGGDLPHRRAHRSCLPAPPSGRRGSSRLAQPSAGLRGGAGRRAPRRRARPDGQSAGVKVISRGARHQPTPTSTRAGSTSGTTPPPSPSPAQPACSLQPRRRLAAGLQPGRRDAARPGGLPSRAVRGDPRLPGRARHRLNAERRTAHHAAEWWLISGGSFSARASDGSDLLLPTTDPRFPRWVRRGKRRFVGIPW